MKSGYVEELKAETPTFLDGLQSGRLSWELFQPFPEQSKNERDRGDELVEDVGALFEQYLDPVKLDLTCDFPPALLKEFRARDFNRLMADPKVGGLGLPYYTVLRMFERVGSWSIPAAQTLAITNTVGPTSLLPGLAEGPLRDFVSRRVADGIICSFGDTGPTGQNNRFASLKATLSEDGTEYILHGRKLFTGNGPIADLIAVSAYEEVDGKPSVCFPFLETSTPGFRVLNRIEFLGSRGFPNAELSFDGVRVPREHVLTKVEEDPAVLRDLSPLAVVFRVLNITSLTLAIGRRCAQWSREFLSRRVIDGRNLGEYDLIQRIVARNLADVYAMDALARWCLIDYSTAKLFDQFLVKPISARTGWRIVDRTMELFGGEGLETERSKERRGASPIPLERYFRDARMLRTIVNVDFQIDNQAGRLLLASLYGQDSGSIPAEPTLPALQREGLSVANVAHLEATAQLVRDFAATSRRLVKEHPDPNELFAKETTVVLLIQIAAELLTMTAVLARTAQLATGSDAAAATGAQDLADIVCTEARHRLADMWRQLTTDDGSAYARMSEAWLGGATLDHLAMI